ncbi:MAG: tetratricopeptide repeat protein, partial [Zoogloea sp.]|uniref:tetratricopeptide repeat protein n=1 Tax=Zoogloea sp. TaxID=49181 RepID=UPI003F2BD52B
QDYDAADAMFRKAIELDPSNARNTGNYANFLANERHDYDAADAMYRKAIELDPNNFNSLANWACLRIVHTKAQDLPEVQQLIQQVIALSKGQVSQTLAEALLYDVLLAATRLSSASCAQSISRLKGALTRGFVRGSWDFSAVFEATFPRIAAEDHDFYRALGSAILDESKVGLLAQYPQWRDAPEGDPFALDAGAGECPANTNTQ